MNVFFIHLIISPFYSIIVFDSVLIRENESVTFSIYLKSEKKIDNFLPYVVNRPLIDGDIFMKDYTIILKNEQKPIIDYFPTPIPLIIRIVSIIVVASILIFLAVMFIQYLIEWLRYYSWKRNYLADFKNYVNIELLKNENNLFNTKWEIEYFKERTNKIIEDPWILEDKYWDHFKGKKVPVRYVEINSWKSFIGYAFLLIIEIAIFSLIILTILKK